MREKLGKYSDFEIMDRIRSDKRICDDAFLEFYSRYSNKIYSYCKCMLMNLYEAEEVFQETFLSFLNSVRKGLEIKNVGGYLFGTARNLCMNTRRSRKITVPISEDDLITDERYSLEKNELFELLIQSLPLLDDKYREAFVLREFDGLQYNEIAEICGITLSGAKTRVVRAHNEIRKVLSPYLKDLYQ